MCHITRLSAFVSIALLRCIAAAETTPALVPETAPPDYSAYKQSYHMPFGNSKPVDFDNLRSLSVRVSVNGGPPVRLQVDTGSTGVILGATDVPNIDPNAPEGSITYTSSGVELLGVWTPCTLTFPDSRDEQGHVASAQLPVLAVRERKIHPGAVNGGNLKPSMNPKVYMLGVGNGRGKEPHQERNPWVNLKEMQGGTMRRGYTITRDGVTLGLTPQVAEGYVFEKLAERTAGPTTRDALTSTNVPRDWKSSVGWVTVAGVKQDPAYMLLDTGLTNMMLEFPSVPPEPEVSAGTQIDVYLLSGRLHYGFRVGDTTNATTARRVTWTRRSQGPMINTGLRALANFDYLYDADGGFQGLRPTRKP